MKSIIKSLYQHSRNEEIKKLIFCFFNKKDYVRVSISYDTRTPISILEELSNDKDEPVRYWVARNPNWIKWTKRKT